MRGFNEDTREGDFDVFEQRVAVQVGGLHSMVAQMSGLYFLSNLHVYDATRCTLGCVE